MNIQTDAPPPLLLFIGVVMICGAAVLAWLSSPSTMIVTRLGPSQARVVIEERLFGLIATGTRTYDDVRGVMVVGTAAPDSTSRTSTAKRMVLETGVAPVDSPAVQPFSRYFTELRDFMADPSSPRLSLSSLVDGWEVMRFGFAQLGALLLAGLGVLLIGLGLRALFPDPNAGIGPV